MSKVIWCALAACMFWGTANAERININVTAGNNQALIDAINTANAGSSFDTYNISIQSGPNGETGFVFNQAYEGTTSALPVIRRNISFGNALDNQADQHITFSGSGQNDFRLLTVAENARVSFWRATITDFGVNGESGGAILTTDNSTIELKDTVFESNYTNMNGGAVACLGDGGAVILGSKFVDNRASNVGGAISIEGRGYAYIGAQDFAYAGGNVFRRNSAGVFGCDLNLQSTGRLIVDLNVFESEGCQNVLIENPVGDVRLSGNTILHNGAAIDSTGVMRAFGNVFMSSPPPGQLKSFPGGIDKPRAVCNDFGSGAFISGGYNVATEDSCFLDQPTDQPNTDPMVSFDDNGLPVPAINSPVIDAGRADVYVPEGSDMAVLPCGFVDIHGVARPQDGNGDGVFECDSGAAEFPGDGMVEAGHSGAFYNSMRNGEGNYVEVLNESLAVVYTFTYRPDGSGPSWFIGVGEIRDNGIVIEELLRPIGTSFGNGFDPEAIDFSEAGGMSIVFPDCTASDMGGSVAYSGHEESGYEGVLSRAQRLTSITGCNTVPTANAGLSGSFFDPARNGEGLIIEWLENGDVLAIFFTFDLNGDQFWTFGVGTPNGTSVTIDALYPFAFTSWGAGFNADDVDLQPWGTFNLNWIDCNNLGFSYSSTVSGYGSASRDYTRVSTLQGTSCPDF